MTSKKVRLRDGCKHLPVRVTCQFSTHFHLCPLFEFSFVFLLTDFDRFRVRNVKDSDVAVFARYEEEFLGRGRREGTELEVVETRGSSESVVDRHVLERESLSSEARVLPEVGKERVQKTHDSVNGQGIRRNDTEFSPHPVPPHDISFYSQLQSSDRFPSYEIPHSQVLVFPYRQANPSIWMRIDRVDSPFVTFQTPQQDPIPHSVQTNRRIR